MRQKTYHYQGALLEEINERFKMIMEILGMFPAMQSDLEIIKADIQEMKDRDDRLELWLKDHDNVLGNHETRLGKLEAA